MSKTVFENHKVALAFAGVTLFGAAVMAATAGDDGGLVGSLTDQRADVEAEAEAFAESRSTPEDDVPPGEQDDSWFWGASEEDDGGFADEPREPVDELGDEGGSSDPSDPSFVPGPDFDPDRDDPPDVRRAQVSRDPAPGARAYRALPDGTLVPYNEATITSRQVEIDVD